MRTFKPILERKGWSRSSSLPLVSCSSAFLRLVRGSVRDVTAADIHRSVIVGAIQSFLTLDPDLQRTDTILKRVGITAFFVYCTLPFIILAFNAIWRIRSGAPSASLLEKPTSGIGLKSWDEDRTVWVNTAPIVVVAALVSFEYVSRAVIVWVAQSLTHAGSDRASSCHKHTAMATFSARRVLFMRHSCCQKPWQCWCCCRRIWRSVTPDWRGSAGNRDVMIIWNLARSSSNKLTVCSSASHVILDHLAGEEQLVCGCGRGGIGRLWFAQPRRRRRRLVQTLELSVSAIASDACAIIMSESQATRRAVAASRAGWIQDLRELLRDAQRRFSDVAWRIDGDAELIHGHKGELTTDRAVLIQADGLTAILYARANAAFQAKYLNPNGHARLQAIMSGSNLSIHNRSPLLGVATSPPSSHPASRAVSPAAASFDSTRSSSIQQSPIVVSGTDAAFFKALLDFLYTGSTTMREAFQFLFEDATFVLDDKEAVDRLSQDLLFAWRSKLFADVRIQITDLLGDIPDGDLSDTATLAEQEQIVSAHRAILSARCPYFASIFLSRYSDAEAESYTLPCPPFTPASLYFMLAYVYSGSLQLNRTFDLSTAMQIWRAAAYLSIDLMRSEVECRMADMCHNFKGCCRACRQRSTRLFSFTVEPDVSCPSLKAASKQVVLRHFGETWNREIGELPFEIQKDLIVDLCQQTTAADVVSASRGILGVRKRLASERAPWADHLRSMLAPLEERLQHFLRTDFAGVALSSSFVELLDGIGFSNDLLESILQKMADCQTEQTAARSYEVLVGKVLLREEGITTDVRLRVEETQRRLLAWIKKRWMNVRSAGGFRNLENWSLKELSDGT